MILTFSIPVTVIIPDFSDIDVDLFGNGWRMRVRYREAFSGITADFDGISSFPVGSGNDIRLFLPDSVGNLVSFFPEIQIIKRSGPFVFA